MIPAPPDRSFGERVPGGTRIRISSGRQRADGRTVAGWGDCVGLVRERYLVEVYEPETGLHGVAGVAEILTEEQLVVLAVNWDNLKREEK